MTDSKPWLLGALLPASASQTLQAELRSCQQKQTAQQLSYESAIAILQADLAALRSRVDDVHSNTQTAVDQIRASIRVQVEQQRSEAEEQLQVGQAWLPSRALCAIRKLHKCLLHDCTPSGAAYRDVSAIRRGCVQLCPLMVTSAVGLSLHALGSLCTQPLQDKLQQRWDVNLNLWDAAPVVVCGRS
jgi:hypothetical protein